MCELCGCSGLKAGKRAGSAVGPTLAGIRVRLAEPRRAPVLRQSAARIPPEKRASRSR